MPRTARPLVVVTAAAGRHWDLVLFLVLSTMIALQTRTAMAWMRTTPTLADRLMGRRATPTELFRRNMIAGQPPQQSSSSPLSTTTKQHQRDMLDFIEQSPPDGILVDHTNQNTSVDDDTNALVHCIVRAADGRKADDIVALRVAHVTTLASVLVILSGNSRPQNQAIAAAIGKAVEAFLRDNNDNDTSSDSPAASRPGGVLPEGSPESGWMVLDYGSVMVHIMTPKSRLYYNVEGQWRDKGGEPMDLSAVLVPHTAPPPTHMWGTDNDDDSAGEASSTQPADDPFWS